MDGSDNLEVKTQSWQVLTVWNIKTTFNKYFGKVPKMEESSPI